MNNQPQIDKITSANWREQPIQEIFPGIEVVSVWQEANRRAIVVTIAPDTKWQGLDIHTP